MKFILPIVVFALVFSCLIAIKNKPSVTKEEEGMDFTETIVSYLGCESEILKNTESVSSVIEKYEELLARGKTEGFTPLIIVPTDMMCELINVASSEYGDTNSRMETIEASAKVIDVTDFLNNRIKEAMPSEEYKDYDIMGEFAEYEPQNSFHSLLDYVAKRPYETIIIAKMPTDKPWLLAAWFPMGGWNECPTPEEQVAVFKYWHEKYGAYPAVVHGDIWEMYVENPPNSKDEAVALALEQFGFCSDIVTQGVEKINALAGTLVDSRVWYFWWD